MLSMVYDYMVGCCATLTLQVVLHAYLGTYTEPPLLLLRVLFLLKVGKLKKMQSKLGLFMLKLVALFLLFHEYLLHIF